MILSRAVLVVVALAALGVARTQTPTSAPPAIQGLDHVPVAVANLEAAAARYRQLGFVLKPGTLHDNGIRNQHAKFPDSTEIELITAPDARDALTTRHRELIAAGDGAAFAAFFAPDPDRLTARLDALKQPYTRDHAFVDLPAGDPLRYVFFGPRNHSPTDRPDYFAHPNSAESLISIWMAAADLSAERRLLGALGSTFEDREVAVPDTVRATVAHLAEGDVLLLPGSRQGLPDRRVVGVTVRVRTVSAVERAMAEADLPAPRRVAQAGTTSVFVPPAIARGLWIEFRAQSSTMRTVQKSAARSGSVR